MIISYLKTKNKPKSKFKLMSDVSVLHFTRVVKLFRNQINSLGTLIICRSRS